MASKKQTVTNFFKPCSKEKPSSKTSKSSDLSLMDQVNLQPNVVCNSSNEPFNPPKNFKFPEKQFGKETLNRSCQPQWFEDHQWLLYDVGKDSLFCYDFQNGDEQSQLQAERKKEKETALISTGSNNWKKALEKFKKYQNSLCHKASLTYEEVREMSER